MKKNSILISNLALINSLFLTAVIFIRFHLSNIFLVACIICVVFILPGLSWLGLFVEKTKRRFVERILFVVFVSTVVMLLGNLLLFFLKLTNSLPAYFIYISLAVNIGIICSWRKLSFLHEFFHGPPAKKGVITVFFVFIFIFAYILSAYYIPPLPDNTLTCQEAAYGLWHYLKPYTFSDDGFLVYYFAHPLLMNFYNANCIFLSGKMEDVKYYYDYSLAASEIYNNGTYAGKTFTVFKSPGISEEFTILKAEGDRISLDKDLPEIYLSPAYANYSDKLFRDRSMFRVRAYHDKSEITVNSPNKGGAISLENTTSKKNFITRNIYEQIQLRSLHDKLYAEFFRNPLKLYSRIVNIFFAMATLAVLLHLLIVCGVSYKEALFLLLFYITLPEVAVRIFGGSRTAITSFCLVMMAYFYYYRNRLALFLSSVLSGLTTQKTVLLPLSFIFDRIVFKNKGSLYIFSVLGFLSGIIIFWFYAAGVDFNGFFTDHIQYHIINRIFHINDLGYAGSYPGLISYWGLFISNLGLPFFLISALGLVFILCSRNSLKFTVLWFVLGAFMFSIVDWRETKHLVLVIIPLILATAYLIGRLKLINSSIFRFMRYGIVMVLAVALILNLYSFLTLGGYNLLSRIGINLNYITGINS